MISGMAIDDFDRWIKELNEYKFERALRKYQLDIIRPSNQNNYPRENQFRPTESIVFRNLDIAYRLCAKRSIWALASGLSRGYPIKEIYDVDSHSIIWSEDNRSQSVFARSMLLDFGGDIPASQKDEGTSIILGDPNFAHFHWNEAPALAHVIEHQLFDPVTTKIHCRVEPLLALGRLFPEVSETLSNDYAAFPFGASRKISVHLGSQFIHSKYSSLVRNAVESSSMSGRGQDILEKMESAKKIIWLAIRNDKRCAVNEVDLLRNLVSEFHSSYDQCLFVLDSFSIPTDFPAAGYQPFAGYLKSRLSAASAYSELIERIFTEASIISATGLRVSEAIRISMQADYFVSPAGSIQHKVGWFSGINGTIHSNTVSMSESALAWYGNQAEVSVTPNGLPSSFVEDESSGRAGRDSNYIIKNVQDAVSRIMVHFEDTAI